MVALKEFANFITHHKADLAQTFAHLLREQLPTTTADADDRHIALARRLLNRVIEAYEAETAEPLQRAFAPSGLDNAHLVLEMLGQTLMPVVTNLEAGKFLWQILSETRANLLNSSWPALAEPSIQPQASQQFDDALRSPQLPAQGPSEEMYRTIFENIVDGYYEVDLAGNLTFFNDALCDMLGYPAAELMGMNNRDFTDEENAKFLFQTFNEIFETGKALKGLEWVFIDKNGQRKYVDTSISLIKDQHNQPLGFRGIARDITERKRTATRLEESEERFRLFMDATPDPVVVYDDDGQVIYLNPAFTRTFGWRLEEVLGQQMDFVPEENIAETKRVLAQLFAKGNVLGFESKRLTKEGGILEVEINGSLLRDEQGQPIGSVIFIHELTDRKQVEDRLAVSLQVAEKQAKRLDLLNELTTTLNQTTDRDEMFKIVAVKTNQIMESDRASVALLNQAGDQLNIFALDGEVGLVPAGMSLPLEGTQIGRTVLTNQLINAPDLTQAEYLEHSRLAEQGLHSTVTVPLSSGEQAIGSLNVASYAIDAFSPELEGLLLQIAAIFSATLENQRLLAQMEQRAIQLETVAKISTAASTILDVNELLEAGVNLIRNEFDFYYVGLFLVDKAAEWAVLQAGTGEAGRVQLERNHRLQIGGESMIGWSIEHQQARIALDVGEDAVRFENPVLPNTRSEMALPLVSRGGVIGALTVQSVDQGAFSSEDITVLQAMADQLANAIANARLFQQTHQRAVQLQTVAQISTAASTILEVNRLLDESVNLIRDRFDFYYVGLFLVDEAQAWAVLQAGTGEAGRVQLERNHRLQIGGGSMIGWSIEHREARIALDVGEDAVRFENPILPDTRSEMALPLSSRGHVIGALTVQSVEQGAFSDEDITLLQAMADQLANAIENTRLFEQAQTSLRETEELYQVSLQLSAASNYDEILQAVLIPRQHGQISNAYLYTLDLDETGRPEWMEIQAGWMAEEQPLPFPEGFRFYLPEFPVSDLWIDNPEEPLLIGNIEQDERVDESARQVFRTVGVQATVILSLRLGERWVGLANFAWVSPQTFNEADTRLYQAIANQAAVLMNNQLLLGQTQRRAERERTIREITEKMRAAPNLERLIKTTAQELGQRFSAEYTLVDLGVDAPVEASDPGENGHH